MTSPTTFARPISLPHAAVRLLARWWAGLIQPSLVRRLLLAQMALLTILWCLGVAWLLDQGGRALTLLRTEHTYTAFLAVADDLFDAPGRRRHSLRAMELALSEYYGDSRRLPGVVIEQNGRVVYRSANLQGATLPKALDAVVAIEADGHPYLARTVQAATGSRMTLFAPDDGRNIFVTTYSDGFYLLPLMISLPFLVLPAWLSIRLALRPWNQVAREVAARGPQDLSPLRYSARHRELGAMVDAINSLMRRVADSAARERSFIADAAHELRTPLAAMRVNVEALRARARNDSERELLAGIINSDNRATRLVSQLLLLMRSDSAEGMPRERVELDQLVQERLAVLSILAATRRIELELLAPARIGIEGQSESLVSLVDNLVENAIKYGPAGGTVRVALRAEEGSAVLSVEDQGPGIAPDLRRRVFDRFYRHPGQTQPGSGLGLAIAQAVVNRHGGAIALLDGEAGGLLVEVRLPR